MGERVQIWDRYLPYLLFAYREVPCESTGYSPLKLLYDRTVRGPLAVVKESWLEKKPVEDKLISHVMEIRTRLATMQQVVKGNLERTQGKQKRMYDIQSSQRKLEVGDKAFSRNAFDKAFPGEGSFATFAGSKLEMRWQGPYTVTRVLEDGLNYELDTGKERKKHRTYHINLLSKWQSRDAIGALVMSESPEMSLPYENNVLTLGNMETCKDVFREYD